MVNSRLLNFVAKSLSLVFTFLILLAGVTATESFFKTHFFKEIKQEVEKKAKATYQYSPTGGTLVTGSEVTVDNVNLGSWRGTSSVESTSNGASNYWTTARHSSNGLDKQLTFDGVELSGANKIIITVRDANITTGNAYSHQICDWVTSTDVDNAAGGNCTGGGWRTLNPRKVDLTPTSDTGTVYEIYDGYFVDTATAPGTPVSTPLTNFVDTGNNNRVLFRVFSTVASTVQHRLDYVVIEPAIDAVYEPADMVKTAGGTITGNLTDLIGPSANDSNRVTVPQPSNGVALDVYFVFKNIKKFSTANTIFVSPELNVSNAALQIGTYFRNFETSSWTQMGSNYGTTGDLDYISSLNSTTVGGFDIDDYISSNDEIWVRFFSNTASPSRNMLMDKLYIIIGSVNTDTAQCETSWGTTNSTTCADTRSVLNDGTGVVSTANTSTWQTAAVIEYPTGHHSLDNDDDANNGEYAFSTNVSFPVAINSNMSVTGIHFVNRYRSNVTTITVALQAKVFASSNSSGNYPSSSGWRDTPSTTTNALTTYGYFDSYRNTEYVRDPEDYIDTTNNLINFRLRTSASTNTTGGVTRDWDFAMASIRYVEETNRRTLQSVYMPSGGTLVTGTESAASNINVGSWRGTIASDSASGGASNYWDTARHVTNGLDKQVYFDKVKLYNANKMIITIEDTNITTGNAYIHQICDWVSSTSVDNAAGGNCTGGGWRSLHPRKTNSTSTNDTVLTFEIYDGYFQDRTTTPGTHITTPLTNFIDNTNNDRVLLRVYSTVASTVVHRWDLAMLEVAIDPIYEPADFVKTAGGTTTNFVSDTYGSGASDNNRFTIPMPAVSTAADVYFVFKNVEPYTGANTILASYELVVSNAALAIGAYLRNFNTSAWTQIGSTNLGTTGEADYAATFNDTSIGGFDIADYISGSNEVWLRLATNTPGTVYNFSVDRVYIMLGSVNTSTSQCETSWGTTNSTTCADTRSLVNDLTSASSVANTTTWQTTSVIEYPAGHHSRDNDDDANASEYAFSSNIDFPITIDNNVTPTAIHHAGRYRSNVTTITVDYEIKRYQGNVGLFGEDFGGIWIPTIGTDTNALTTYLYTDTYRAQELQHNVDDMLSTYSNVGNIRLRTSLSTNVAGGVTRDWDFAMLSMRYLREDPVISVSVSDGTVAYGLVALSGTRSTIDLSDQQTITNNGTVLEEFNIKGQNTGCPWTLSGTIGADQYKHAFCKASDVSCASPPTNFTNLTTSYQLLYTNINSGGDKDLDLNLSMPSTTSCYTQQSIDVTIQAVEL